MFKNKTILLLIGLIILLLVVMVVQFTIEKGTPSPTPTPTPKPSGFNISNIPFEVKSTNLGTEPINVADIITITFSKPVGQKNFFYSINPEIALNLSFDKTGNFLMITPQKGLWGFDKTYQLVIKKETKSFDGNNLKEDVIINFKTVQRGGI